MRRIISALLASALFTTVGYAASATLSDAAEANDPKRVRALIGAGTDPNHAQPDGMTALHWASYHDNLDTATALLDANADVTSVTRYGITPLILACRNGNESLVGKILNAGADPNTTAPGGETVLMTASRTGKLAPVKALLQAGAKIDAALPNGQTALMWAAAENNLEVARALIDAGADFKAPLESGYTALFFAVRQGHREMTRLFLDNGAALESKMEPTRRGDKLPRAGTTPLILAIENGHFELALDLLDLGADPNDANSRQTPLHHLVRVRKPDRGEGAAGEPPPPILGDIDSLEFAVELVKRGADVNAQIVDGRIHNRGKLNTVGATPFFLASDTADIAYMKLLLDLGADPFIPNNVGTTPFMAAAGLGSSAPEEEAGTPEECLVAVEFLVSLGAEINTVNEKGETAMHGAAYKNAPQVVRYLHSLGADIDIWNTKNKLGWTPLYIAEGYRPGNFKPSFETVDAISEVMTANGLDYPTEPRPRHVNYSQ